MLFPGIMDLEFPVYAFLSTLSLFGLYKILNFVLYRFSGNNLPGMKLRFYDLAGDMKNVPKEKCRNQEYAIGTYILEVMSAYTQLFRNKSMFMFWMSSDPTVVLVKAKAVEELISGTKMMEKGYTYTWLQPWLGTGLLTSSGQKWKSRRKLLTPSFHFEILKDFLPLFNEHSFVLIKKLEKETQKPWTDITIPVTLCTLDIVCETTLGVNVGAQNNSESEYVKAVIRASNMFNERAMNGLYFIDWIFERSKLGRQFRKDLALLHGFTRSVIKEKKQKLLQGDTSKLTQKRKALMDVLLEHHVQNKTLTEEDVREEVDTFAFAGHDTTSMGISWALYLIGLYKEVQEKLHEEIYLIFGDDTDRHVTTDDLKDMKYLECVLKESQRLYPSVSMFGRLANEEVVIGGYNVPKGSSCFVFTYELHRDPEVFPDPEKFDPDRFLPENSVGRHPYAYIPFSAGPRNCIGQRFAMMEEKTIVSNILRNYTVESLDQRDQLPPITELVLRNPKPIRIKIRRRR